MSQEQTLTQLYESFKPTTGFGLLHNFDLVKGVDQWLHLRILSAREHKEKFFCTEIKEDGLTAICWVRKNSSSGIVYERKGSLTLQHTFDYGKSNIFNSGTKNEKKRMKLVSGFVSQLLESEEIKARKFKFAFLLFQHFIEGYLMHQKDYEQLLFWCRQLLKKTKVMENKTEKRLQAREGEILEALGRYDEAVASYQKCVSICETPDEFAHLYNCIGVALRLAGKIDDSIEMYKKSLHAQQNIVAHGNLLTAIQIKHELVRCPRIDGYDHKKQADSDYTCRNCHKSGAVKICSRCRKARYCNAKCQKQDWKRHKHVCSKYGNEIPRRQGLSPSCC